MCVHVCVCVYMLCVLECLHVCENNVCGIIVGWDNFYVANFLYGMCMSICVYNNNYVYIHSCVYIAGLMPLVTKKLWKRLLGLLEQINFLLKKFEVCLNFLLHKCVRCNFFLFRGLSNIT